MNTRYSFETIYLVGGGCHATSVEINIESGAKLSGTGSDMNAVGITIMTFGEDHSVEWPVEFNVDSHVRLFALNLQVFDLWLVTRCTNWPLVFGSRTDRATLWWVAGQAGWRWWQQSWTTRTGWNVVGWQWDLAFVVIGCRCG